MAFTKDDIDALDEAIASGELTVKIDGREVTYRSLNDSQG
ncbi:phage head-tail joining protein [Vibrio parahaemolyticus]